MKSFGDYLKSIRESKGLSQRELQDISGVSNAYLSQIENGKRGIPSVSVLKKIHRHLGVSYDEIMLQAGYLKDDKNFLPSDHEILLLKELRKYQELYSSLLENPENISQINDIWKLTPKGRG